MALISKLRCLPQILGRAGRESNPKKVWRSIYLASSSLSILRRAFNGLKGE